MSYLSGNRGECGKNGVDFCSFRASYQHRVDNSVEKLHLSKECEANVESGGVEKFHAPAEGICNFEIAGMLLSLDPKRFPQRNLLGISRCQVGKKSS